MKISLLSTLIALGLTFTSSAFATESKPTIVLVHGAFADASSWNGVITRLEKDGYPVVAVANPLRSVKTDAAYVTNIITSLKTPVVLVGHSYGGTIISQAAETAGNVTSLVYVSAFAPDLGETAASLSGKFPGGTLGSALGAAVKLEGGTADLYIQRDKFHDQFAADVPEAETRLMAATQRPVTDAALNEPVTSAAWKKLPSFFIYGDADKNIPAKAIAWMAERANSKETIVIKGGSHVVMISHPDPVTKLIEHAAQ
ncbi:alpha/beta hydrolase [Phyllobacterium sp. OV277]|uniref:alpha/beta fold hydrolase n=1 Tax=Phyllobacterium sp. OV277 TaxID=1882772 RepID=UPI0008887CB6|nr:alpha/beta hydrolase [Phyllobacterium sp. OV277]SDP71414.1 Pimeloyl-ACP methyl ester carboxylesterase [Phyllobacterium sp. OV277]